MEEVSERAVLRNLQKEQEREKRRIRDRQRRQSMSVEEREKHLARRRRNYQLRRQRAEVTPLDPQFNQSSLPNRGEIFILPSNHCREMIPVPSANVQHNGFDHVPSDQRRENLIAGQTNSIGLEISGRKLAKLPTRPRLSHVKDLARLVDDPVDNGNSHSIAADLIMRGYATFNCMPPKGLRLNHVKQIARALNSYRLNAVGTNHQSEIEGFFPQLLKANNFLASCLKDSLSSFSKLLN